MLGEMHKKTIRRWEDPGEWRPCTKLDAEKNQHVRGELGFLPEILKVIRLLGGWDLIRPRFLQIVVYLS